MLFECMQHMKMTSYDINLFINVIQLTLLYRNAEPCLQTFIQWKEQFFKYRRQFSQYLSLIFV